MIEDTDYCPCYKYTDEEWEIINSLKSQGTNMVIPSFTYTDEEQEISINSLKGQ